MNTAIPLLEVRAIGHKFGGLHVLRDVNCCVKPGAVTGLIGPNGSGKSTLFNIITGYLQPQTGNIFFDEIDTAGNPPELLSHIGIIRTFQTPQVFHNMSVLDNVMTSCVTRLKPNFFNDILGLSSSKRQMEKAKDQAMAVCDEFGLSELILKMAGELSAGQRRTLELARAVACKPRLLMLDEPSSGLNLDEIEALKKCIGTLSNQGVSVFLVSHDMSLMQVASRVHVLYYGEVIAVGTMAEIYDNKYVQQVYLGIAKC